MSDFGTPSAAPARAERRLAAILAADVVGYSRLMERDEEGTHERLRALIGDMARPQIDRHRGRVVKSTGDGFLAEFASALEAVRCAVAMQQAMVSDNRAFPEERRITFRMGINLGDILIEGSDVFGEGVNLAARLEGLAEAGGILVSHTIHDQVHGKLPFRFEDLGERSVKNIERPLRVFRVIWDEELRLEKPTIAIEQPSKQKLSLAVLPFTNMSSDPEQEYFADGLAEDLITDLSKVPGLMVIARNSSFVFKGRSVDIRSVAKDLGVRYVIEGSVRRAAGRVRINAQLIDANDNSHVWADRFDSDLADVFSLQDEVVRKIVSTLSGVLPISNPLPTRRAANLEAYDLFVRARSLVTHSPEGTHAARPLFERAIDLDPGFADAHAWLAMSYHFGWMYWGNFVENNPALARAAAERAVSLDPDNADAHMVLGHVRTYNDELDAGIAEFETALRLNPNHADAWMLFADLKVFDGKRIEALDCMRNAFRLNPHPPGDYYWMLGFVEYAARDYDAAVKTLRLEAASGTGAKRVLAATLAQLGRMDEAREEAQLYLAAIPNFSARRWGSTQPFRNDADRQHFVEGYLKAGLPA